MKHEIKYTDIPSVKATTALRDLTRNCTSKLNAYTHPYIAIFYNDGCLSSPEEVEAFNRRRHKSAMDSTFFWDFKLWQKGGWRADFRYIIVNNSMTFKGRNKARMLGFYTITRSINLYQRAKNNIKQKDLSVSECHSEAL